MDDFEVGRHVKLTLRSKHMVEGTIFAVDTVGRRLVLEETVSGADPNLRNTRIVNTESIQAKFFGDGAPVREQLPKITVEQAKLREKAAAKEREDACLRSSEAIEVFKILNKMLKCRWNGDVIEEEKLGVCISPPYKPENVTGSESRSVEYVQGVLKKILQGST